MTVYVDLLFWLNTLINFLLLRGSGALSGCRTKLWRYLCAAAVGGLYAVFCVLPVGAYLQNRAAALFFGILMLVICFGLKKNTLRQGLYFFALSFAFGGAVLLLIQIVEPDCIILGGNVYYALSVPALLLLAGACYALAATVLKGSMAHTGGDLVTVQITAGDQTAAVKALRDTGNTLRDPLTGQTVLVADGALLCRLLPCIDLTPEQLSDPASALPLLAAQYPKCKFTLVPYRAVGTAAGLLLALRCTVREGRQTRRQLVAFCPAPVSGDGKFEALLGGAFS